MGSFGWRGARRWSGHGRAVASWPQDAATTRTRPRRRALPRRRRPRRPRRRARRRRARRPRAQAATSEAAHERGREEPSAREATELGGGAAAGGQDRRDPARHEVVDPLGVVRPAAPEEAFEAAGVEYDIQNAEGDKNRMATIADQMITSGVDRADDHEPRLRVGRRDPAEGRRRGRPDDRLRPPDAQRARPPSTCRSTASRSARRRATA